MAYTDVMNPLVKVVRAVGVEFVRRTIRPIAIIVVVAIAVLLIAGAWLTTQNVWWWIFEAVFIVAALVTVVVLIVLRIVMKLADPRQTHGQKQAVISFVDKLERTTEHLHTPYYLIIARVIRDVVRRRTGKDSFIVTVSHDSATLAPDFVALQRLFND